MEQQIANGYKFSLFGVKCILPTPKSILHDLKLLWSFSLVKVIVFAIALVIIVGFLRP